MQPSEVPMEYAVHTPRRRRAQAGYTMMEMVTVLAVTAGTAAMAVPGMKAASAERAVANVQSSVMRLMRRGRSHSFMYGRAHLIRYRKNVGFELWRGKTSSCTREAWYTEIIAGPAITTAGSFHVEDLDLSTTDYEYSAVNDADTAYNDIDFCYQPNGTSKWRTGSGMNDATAFVSANTSALKGGFIFKFRRKRSGSAVGGTRKIVLPFGGSIARVRL